MTAKSFVVEEFGGLNLRDDPQQIGPTRARELSNVVVADGVLRTRNGAALHIERADALSYYFLHPLPNSNRILLGVDTTIEVRDSTGASVASSSPGAVKSAVNIATAAQVAGTYVGISGAAARFISTAGAISAPAFVGHTPSAGILGVMPKTFRLVSTDGAHRVWFSNQGDPLTFNTDDFVDLWPNDGETILWMQAWRDLLFVFKRTKFAVFYAENKDDDNSVIFEYYSQYNIPALDFAGGKPVTAGRDGIYYISREGVYVTTGGKPERISGDLDPYFMTLPTSTVGSIGKPGYTTTITAPWLHYDQDFLYVVPPDENESIGASSLFAYDFRRAAWTSWFIGPSAGESPGITAVITQPTGSATSNRPDVLIATPWVNNPGSSRDWRSGVNKLTDDLGEDQLRETSGNLYEAPVVWSYTSGFYDLGSVTEKRVQFARVFIDELANELYMSWEVKGKRGSLVPDPLSKTITSSDLLSGSGDQVRVAPTATKFRLISHAISGIGLTQISRIQYQFAESRSPL